LAWRASAVAGLPLLVRDLTTPRLLQLIEIAPDGVAVCFRERLVFPDHLAGRVSRREPLPTVLNVLLQILELLYP
jgi:hypothetical protein